MPLTRTIPPQIEPVSLAEVQNWLRNTTSSDEANIDRLIKAATERAEIDTQRSLLPQTWTLRLDSFFHSHHVFLLPRPPLVAVTSVQYVDVDDVLQTLSSSLYQVDIFSEPGRLSPIDGQSWPTTKIQLNAVTIIYTAGYAEPELVPETIKSVIKMMVDHTFEHRGEVTELKLMEPPVRVMDMLFPHRVY